MLLDHLGLLAELAELGDILGSLLREPHVNLATAFDRLGLYDSAIVHGRRAIRLGSHTGIAYNNTGLAFYHIQQYDSALANFAAALEQDPELVSALSNRGILYLEMGDTARARRDLEAVIALGSDPGLTADARVRLRRLRGSRR